MEIIIPIAAIAILWLVFTWSIQVFKSTIKTLLAITAIFILVQIVFDISSEQIMQELIRLVNRLQEMIFGI